jgi:hypothetical protein
MKPRSTSFSVLVVFFLVIILSSVLASGQIQCAQGVCVTTWHNDIGRTGQNTQEATLTTTLVGDPTIFGRKCRYPLLTDEWVFAQPLGVTNVVLQGDSNKCQDPTGVRRDAPGSPTGFSVPTVANGNVYIGTQTDFDIYGQVVQRTCGPGF